jgi:multicomponent Na+:H+ antiporter subunit A
MRRSLILVVSARALTPVLLLVSLYVTFRGHNAPGGGFAGGLIMSAAVVLRYLSEGAPGVDRLRLDPVWLIAGGLGLSVITTAAPLAFGLNVMDGQMWDLHLPAIGDVHVPTAGIFDVGVHLLVVGVVMAIVLTFVAADAEAAELGPPIDRRRAGATGPVDDAGGRR